MAEVCWPTRRRPLYRAPRQEEGDIADADQEKEFDEAIGSGRPLAAESAFKKQEIY